MKSKLYTLHWCHYYILVTTSINRDYSLKFCLQVVSRQPLAQRLHLHFSHLDCIKVLLPLLVFSFWPVYTQFFFPFFPFVPLVVMVCRDLSHSWLSFTWACAERRGGLSKESPAPLILPPPQRWKKTQQNKTKQKGTAFLLSILISLFGKASVDSEARQSLKKTRNAAYSKKKKAMFELANVFFPLSLPFHLSLPFPLSLFLSTWAILSLHLACH